jgi:putative DNA primase/helicase
VVVNGEPVFAPDDLSASSKAFAHQIETGDAGKRKDWMDRIARCSGTTREYLLACMQARFNEPLEKLQAELGQAQPAQEAKKRYPYFVVLDEEGVIEGKKCDAGTYLVQRVEPAKGKPYIVRDLICGPLHIQAQTRDGAISNFGRLLRFKDTQRQWHTWSMPMVLLGRDGADVVGELLRQGLFIDPSMRNNLLHYLQAAPPEKALLCALHTGWCGKVFALQNEAIGPGKEGVVLQLPTIATPEFAQAGTLEGWKGEIAARAVGNPLLMLALSAAFAGPILAPTRSEGGGLHIHGDSSTGKSTTLEAFCSVWGGPKYKRSWKTTANGMEGVFAQFNECGLGLDELSECDPREVEAIVYAATNGRGKQRANRIGGAREIAQWQLQLFSTGERAIATVIESIRHKVKAGVAVRMIDLPADRKHGCWDELHGFADGGAFANAIKKAAATHYGVAARAYLERLTHDDRDLCPMLEAIRALPAFNPEDAEGQGRRVAARFAVIALAGELATEYGLTGWEKGAATKAAAMGVSLWLGQRGKGNGERRQIFDQVRDFIDRHGSTRFAPLNPEPVFQNLNDPAPGPANHLVSGGGKTIERAGWYEDVEGDREYLATPDGMREILNGLDFNRALEVLEGVGAIPPKDAQGKRAHRVRVDGTRRRLYRIRPDNLPED